MAFFFLIFLMKVTIYPIALLRLDVDFLDTLYNYVMPLMTNDSVLDEIRF